MNIAMVQIGNTAHPLAEGQPVLVSVGQTLRVFYSFSYKVAERTSVPIWASLYQKIAGVVNRAEQAQTKTTITFDAAIAWQTYQGQIDIAIGSMGAGLYGLIVELPGFKDAEARIDDCIEVAAAPGIGDMLGPLMMIMMMGMIMPMMEGIE